MLVNLRDICSIAEQNNMAIGAFNAPSFEAVRAVIDAAEETGYPVILQHAECHEDMTPLDKIGPAMVDLAERSTAQICVHLDHGENLSYLHRALEYGFTGIMFDGSALPYEDNVYYSARAAEMCRGYNCGLECELGSMGAREGDVLVKEGETPATGGTGAVYTDPDQAREFVAATGLDILACSFGTVHGLYRGEPHLSFEVLEQIRDRIRIPLVMHGGSGVSDDDYRQAINVGIRKINYYTYGAKYAGEAACQVVDTARAKDSSAVVYWHDLTGAAYECLVKDFIQVMKVFANGAAPLA